MDNANVFKKKIFLSFFIFINILEGKQQILTVVNQLFWGGILTLKLIQMTNRLTKCFVD